MLIPLAIDNDGLCCVSLLVLDVGCQRSETLVVGTTKVSVDCNNVFS